MQQQATTTWVSYYYPNSNTHVALYVSELPGEGGVDWGYTPDASKAKPLTDYWWKRFAANRRHCGHAAMCYPAGGR